MPSSVIASYSYDATRQVLRIVFLSGSVYDYLDVPEEIWLEMKRFRSKGTFLNRFIKGRFRFRKRRLLAASDKA